MKETAITIKIKHIIRALVFLFLLFLLLFVESYLFREYKKSSFQVYESYYQEPTGEVDAVYIGASNVYTSWEAPIGWKMHGVRMMNFSAANMPAESYRYMLEEVRKEQPDAMYIIAVNGFKTDRLDAPVVHWLMDHMHLSPNKLSLAKTLTLDQPKAEDSASFAEVILPFIRFHSDWESRLQSDLILKLDGLKGGRTGEKFLEIARDVTDDQHITEKKAELSEEKTAVLNELLTYCETNCLNVLFVITPQALSEEDYSELNTVEDLISSHSFPILNLLNETDAIGLDLSTDFYDNRHMNIHGCIKYMDYFGTLLREEYGLPDRSGEATATSAEWDAAYRKYKEEYLVNYLSEEEFQRIEGN